MTRWQRRIQTVVVSSLVLLTSSCFIEKVCAQTKPPEAVPAQSADNGSGQQLSTGAAQTQNTVPNSPYSDASGLTSLVQQAAEQNTQQTIVNTNDKLLQGSELAQYNDTYAGMKAFWSDDMISNFFANIGQVIGRWVTELIDGWVSDTVQFLTAFLRTFVLNPNIAVNGLTVTPNAADGLNKSDDISPYIRQGADTMYGIAVDLLLLLFILCIWKYWVDAAWRGGANLMGTVGRLIFTSGLLLAWPTIYAFEIQISNEMIKAIYFNSADQVMMLDAAMAAAVKGGLVAGAGLLANTFAPVIGSIAGGIAGGGAMGSVLGTVGGVVAFAGLLIYLILGGILIAELIYILVLKAIQTALLTAQYMFAPIFIVFFATPDTENVCSGFIKSFVEVSLWTFVWVGLLKILVIILFSDFNPWGKIIIAIGVLQLMIQTPAFMARAQISPMSDFISAGLIAGGLMKGVGALGNLAQTTTGQLFQYGMTDKFAARGLSQSQKVSMENLPQNVANPELLKSLRDAADGKVGKNDPPPGPDGLPLKPPDGSPPGGPDSAPTVTPPDKKNPLASDEKGKSKELDQTGKPPITGAMQGPESKENDKTAEADRGDRNSKTDKKNKNESEQPFNPLFKNGLPEIRTTSKGESQASQSKSESGSARGGQFSQPRDQPKDLKSGNDQSNQSNQSSNEVTLQSGNENTLQTGKENSLPPGNVKDDPKSLNEKALQSGIDKARAESGTAQGGTDKIPPKSVQTPEGSLRRNSPGSFAVGPLAPAAGTGARIVAQSQHPTAVKQGRNIDPTTSILPEQLQENVSDEDRANPNFSYTGISPTSNRGEPFQSFNQHNYVWVPGRDLGVAVRTAQGPTMGPSVDGKANIVGNSKGQVNHIRFGAKATPEQQALQTFVAGFAQLCSADSEGYDAARQAAIDANEDGPKGLFERAAAGFMAHNGGSFKQTAVAKERMQKSVLKHSIIGGEAYMTMQPGNAFTEFLTSRFGPMTPDRQAWGVHIMTDESSPESPWNPRVGPATESCAAAGVPIGGHRAAAANPSVLKQPAWGRGPAIRGVAAYATAIVNSKVPENTHPMVIDALFGREAPNVGSAEVGACMAIMLESPSTEAGQLACSNTDMVQSVAQLVAGGHQKDYVSAYRSLRGMVRTVGSGRGGRMNSTDFVRVDVRADAPPQNRAATDIGGFVTTGGEPQMQEHSSQVVDFNLTPSNEIGHDTTSSASINFGVDAQVTSSHPELRITGDTGSRRTVTSEHFVSAIGENSGSFAPGADVSELATKVAAAASASAKNSIYHAQQLIVDMHSAGFSEDQIQDPRIAATALQVYEHDASMLGTAAVTARIMGPAEFNKSSTQVVQQMVDCGWSANKISRPDVYTAHSIMQNGGSPTPSVVQTIRMMPDFNPRPNVALPQQVVDGAHSAGNFDDFVTSLNAGFTRY